MSKLTKMSFGNIKGILSRDEMSKIMAGSQGSYCGSCVVQGHGQSSPSFESCTRNEVSACMCPNGNLC